jgi:hypothetical protein
MEKELNDIKERLLEIRTFIRTNRENKNEIIKDAQKLFLELVSISNKL